MSLLAQEMRRLVTALRRIFGEADIVARGVPVSPPLNSPHRADAPPTPVVPAPPEVTLPPEVRAALLSIGLVEPGSPKSLRTYIRTMIRNEHPDQVPEAQRASASRKIQQISAAQRVLRRYHLLD